MNKDVSKISLKNVCKSFGDKSILKGINLDIKKGESFVIIGGSGTGKSVTIKCIQGLIKTDSGSIKIDGQELTDKHGDEKSKLTSKMSMLFQGGALFDSLNVLDNVIFGLVHAKKMKKITAEREGLKRLEQVGLAKSVAQKFPSELSGGMKKRVGLARAIAVKPEIIFFDEPTTGLDPIMSDVINNLIVKTTKELGVTAVTITHDMVSARKIADNIGLLYEGKIIWTGKVKELDKTSNAYVKQFVKGSAQGPIKLI